MSESYNNIPENYNELTFEEQQEYLREFPIGYYVSVPDYKIIGPDGINNTEYQIIGYRIVTGNNEKINPVTGEEEITHNEWINVILDKHIIDIDIDEDEWDNVMHPGLLTLSKKQIRINKLKQLGV